MNPTDILLSIAIVGIYTLIYVYLRSIYKSYKLNPEVTESRIYLETMEKVFSRVKKIIMDKSASSSGVVPYLPLDQLKQKGDK